MGVEGPSVGCGVSSCCCLIGLQPWLPTTGMPGPHPLAGRDGGGQWRPPDADIWGCQPTEAWTAELKTAALPTLCPCQLVGGAPQVLPCDPLKTGLTSAWRRLGLWDLG